MINRFALSFLCIDLDRNEMCGVMLVHILLTGPLFLHCLCITEQPAALTIMVSSSLVRSRAIAVLLPLPQNVHGTGSLVSFIENAHIAILASDSKLSFWAEWTVMNNCRSQFGWQSAQLKESAISRVVERQVTPDLPVSRFALVAGLRV